MEATQLEWGDATESNGHGLLKLQLNGVGEGWRLPTIAELQEAHERSESGFEKTGNYASNESVPDGPDPATDGGPGYRLPKTFNMFLGKEFIIGTHNSCLIRLVKAK